MNTAAGAHAFTRIALAMSAAALLLTCSRDTLTTPVVKPLLAIWGGKPCGTNPNPALGGENQSGQVGQPLASPLIVQVLDVAAGTRNGQSLNFVVTSGGGTVFATVVRTASPSSGPAAGCNGIGEDTWTLGPTAGPQTVAARVVDPTNGATLTEATFHGTALAGPASVISAQAGRGRTALVGSPVDTAPAVLVSDQFGNPVSNVTVTFQVTGGGGSVANPSQPTDTKGIATAGRWTLGPQAGPNTLTATSTGLTGSPVTFTATATGPAGLNITNYRGDVQTQVAGTTLLIVPAAQVTDLNGHPVPGVQVVFSVTAGGGSITGAAQVTDASGIATVGSWTLGVAAGVNELQAMFNTGTSRGTTIFVATGTAPGAPCAPFGYALEVNVNEFDLAVKAGVLPSLPTGLGGLGFFEGKQVIFGGGPIYGTDPNHLVIGYDVRGALSQDIANAPICVLQTSPVHHTIAQLPLTAGATGPAGLAATQESFAFPSAPDNGYVLLRYVFRDTAAAPITNFYAGFVMDWDLYFDANASATDDAISFNSALGIGEATEFDAVTYPQVVGLVPMATSGAISFRGWAQGAGDAMVTTRSGYFAFLSGGINNSSTGPADIRELMGLGPLTIQPGQSVVVYIAIVGGENQAAFSNNVAHARQMAATLGFTP
jgi:hypothetical protein